MASIHPHLRFNPCTKCQGTIAYYQDQHGPYAMCLQCGQSADIPASPQQVSPQDVSAQDVRKVLARVREVSGPSYRTTECEASPSCLTCPLPACKHEVPSSGKWPADRERLEVMVRDNMTNRQAADRFGVSRNSITNMWARDALRNRAG